MDREELIDRLEERSRVQDQLTLKPSVAKKLNSKITGLEAELAVLRGSKKVDSMEKKILKLEAELKQSYSTKNFTVKSGLLDIEKAYRDFIDSHKDVQALWGEIMLLTVEDKDGLPTGTVSQRRAAMNSAEQAAVERPPLAAQRKHTRCAPRGAAAAAHPPTATVCRMVRSCLQRCPSGWPPPVRGSPPLAADDGDGSGGGGALHLHASSYVQSQVCRFKEASAPSSANLSGNSTPLRSTSSAYATRLDGRGTCADSAQQEPDFPHPQAEAPHHPSLGERGGVSGITAAHAAVGGAEVALSPAGPAAAAAAAVQMLRPHSLLTAAGRVDASALEQHASHFLLSISQLKELYRGFGYHPGMPASPGAATAASSVSSSTGSSSSRPITPSPPDASEVDSQVESLIVSVEQMRALFSQAGSSAPKPAAPGHIPSHDHHTCSVTPDASGYSTQAEAALQSIQHLREMFRQAQAAHTSGGGSSSSTAPDGDDGRVPDARYFDKQVEALMVSVASLQTLFAASHTTSPPLTSAPPDHATQQHHGPPAARSHPSGGPSPPAGTHPHTHHMVHLLASFLEQLNAQGLYPSHGNPAAAQHHPPSSAAGGPPGSGGVGTPTGGAGGGSRRPAAPQSPPSIEQLLRLFSCYLATGQAKAAADPAPAPSTADTGTGDSPQAGGGGADAASPAVDVAGAVALLLQLPSDAPSPVAPAAQQLPVPPGPLPAGPSDAVHPVAVAANGGVDAVGDGCTRAGSSGGSSGGSGGGGHAHVAQCGSSPGLDHGRGPPGSLATSTAGGAIDPSSAPDATHGVRLPPHAAPHAPESFAHTPHQNQQPAPHHPTVSATAPNTPHRPLQSEAQGLGVQALLGQLRVKHASLLAASPGAETLLQDALQLLSLAQPHPPTADGPLPATQPPTHPSASTHVSTQHSQPSQAQHSQPSQAAGTHTPPGVAVEGSETQGGGDAALQGAVPGMPPTPFFPSAHTAPGGDLPRVHADPSSSVDRVMLHPPGPSSASALDTPAPAAASEQGAAHAAPPPAAGPRDTPLPSSPTPDDVDTAAARLAGTTRTGAAGDAAGAAGADAAGGARMVITLGEPVSPDGHAPGRHPSARRPSSKARRLHVAAAGDAALTSSSSGPVTLSEITPVQEEDPRGNGPPAARVSLEGHRPGTAAAAAAPDTLPASKEASDGGPEDGSTPGTPTHASAAAGGGSSSGGGIGAEVITPPSASVSAAAAAAAAGGQTAEASRPSFPESLAAAYQLAGMTPPTAGASSAPASPPPSAAGGTPVASRRATAAGGRQLSVDESPMLGVVVDDDLASGERPGGGLGGGASALGGSVKRQGDGGTGLSHLREAKATLTEKVIAYEALILRLSEQMRVAVEAGDDAGGRVAALTSEVDTLARERGVLDRRLQDCQEESTTVTSELIVRKMSLAQLTEDFQKLSKAHREAQGKEQLMLARICELERLLAVVNPNDEIVQLDDTYSVRVRTSTSSLDDPPSSPTSADRSERAPALGAVATAEAADGVSIVEPLRLSASVARHADDPRHAARHAGHQNNANSAGAPGVSSEPVQGATPPTTLVNGGGGVGGGTVSGGLGGPGGGSASAGGGSQKASTPGGGGRRRAKNLSVVPEEVVTSSGSPT
ncbi:MAG: hypothetical protein WDW36_008964 [Sanguina aurantia]